MNIDTEVGYETVTYPVKDVASSRRLTIADAASPGVVDRTALELRFEVARFAYDTHVDLLGEPEFEVAVYLRQRSITREARLRPDEPIQLPDHVWNFTKHILNDAAWKKAVR